MSEEESRFATGRGFVNLSEYLGEDRSDETDVEYLERDISGIDAEIKRQNTRIARHIDYERSILDLLELEEEREDQLHNLARAQEQEQKQKV